MMTKDGLKERVPSPYGSEDEKKKLDAVQGRPKLLLPRVIYIQLVPRQEKPACFCERSKW
jgi:hypothetical protein